MNYTILNCQDLASGQVLDMVKNGNIYNIEFTNGDKFLTISFEKLEEAKEKYLKIIECFINDYYTFEQRIEILKGER